MKKSKIIFLIIAAVFLAVLGFFVYDISSRTTWPGSKPQLIDRVFNSEEEAKTKVDTIKIDSLIIEK